MPDYTKAKIYRIVSDLNDMVYYGSTVQPLSLRLGQHVSKYKTYVKTGKGGCTSRKIIASGKGNYHILHVEDFPCNSKEKLVARERYYIEGNVCVNKCIPGRTVAEYKKAGCYKTKRYKEYNKAVQQKPETKEYRRQYYKWNKEMLGLNRIDIS